MRLMTKETLLQTITKVSLFCLLQFRSILRLVPEAL